MRSPEVVQLLQQPLLALPTQAQLGVLASTSSALEELLAALAEVPSSESSRAASVQLLGGVLRQQAVHSAGVLLMWLHQQPQQLCAIDSFFSNPWQPGSIVGAYCIGGVWQLGMEVVHKLAVLLFACMSGGSSCAPAAARLAADMTQQLLHSGGCACCCVRGHSMCVLVLRITWNM